MDIQCTENTQLNTSESVPRKMTDIPDENVDTEEEMDFDDWCSIECKSERRYKNLGIR